MWGSINTATTDTCTTCPNFNECGRSVHALGPVLCENTDLRPRARPAAPRRHIARHYTDHLTPGETFTAEDLAARAGVPTHSVSNWIANTAKTAGYLQPAGRIKVDARHYAKLYTYQP